jgi:cyclohexa-1,5-dienecarbonyl-CoA hydratase
VTNAVARITLNHPRLNVIDVAMMEELSRALADIETQPEICAIVINGAGAAFSAGVDVAAHTPDKVRDMLEKFHAVIRSMVACKKVTVASVHGHCLGGGAEIAMICDIVFTSRSAQWAFPEIKLGCFPPVACAALAALVGQKRASELILTGRMISGAEAAHIGLATHAVSDDELPSSLEDVVAPLRGLSPAALAASKKAFYGWDAAHFDKGLARSERVYLDELMKTEDAQEGIRAFMDKRQPRWVGK